MVTETGGTTVVEAVDTGDGVTETESETDGVGSFILFESLFLSVGNFMLFNIAMAEVSDGSLADTGSASILEKKKLINFWCMKYKNGN